MPCFDPRGSGVLRQRAGPAPLLAFEADPETITGCRVTDGDTIRCGGERIRLLGIDAPELAGHCRRGRICAPGDGKASKRSLEVALSGRVIVERIGGDRCGRPPAPISAGGRDLSCRQLSRGQAVYKRAWDDGGRIRKRCRLLCGDAAAGTLGPGGGRAANAGRRGERIRSGWSRRAASSDNWDCLWRR